MFRTEALSQGVDIEGQPEDSGVFYFFSHTPSLSQGLKLQAPLEEPGQKGGRKEKIRLAHQLIRTRRTRKTDLPTPVSIPVIFILVTPI